MNTSIHVLSRAVVIDQGHILLAYDPRNQPNHYYELNQAFYYLPGGHVEYKESSVAAVIREIEEETGHKATCLKFLGVLEYSWNAANENEICHTHEINLIFRVEVEGLRFGIDIPQKEAHVAFHWKPFSQLQSLDLCPESLKQLLPKWLESSLNDKFGSAILKDK